MGARGDAILQLDWSVGELMKALDRMNLAQNTILIFSSDNGPVVDDGYQDEAVAKLNGHTPAGPLRGGKYSAFEAGTRVPFILRWPSRVKPGVSDALVSQVDLLASFAALTGQKLNPEEAQDSYDMLSTFTGKSAKGRDHVVEHALNGTLALIKGDWKFIEPSKGSKINKNVNIELGNDPNPQLYNLKRDIGESRNVAQANPKIVKEMEESLRSIRNGGQSRLSKL